MPMQGINNFFQVLDHTNNILRQCCSWPNVKKPVLPFLSVTQWLSGGWNKPQLLLISLKGFFYKRSARDLQIQTNS